MTTVMGLLNIQFRTMDDATKARKARQAYKEANRLLYVEEDNLYSMRMRVEQQILSAKLGKVYSDSTLVKQIVERVLDESLGQDNPITDFELTGEMLLKIALMGVPAEAIRLKPEQATELGNVSPKRASDLRELLADYWDGVNNADKLLEGE